MADYYFFLGGNYKEILSIQTCCITACKDDSFLLACITRANSFDSSLVHFVGNCVKNEK